MAEIYEIVGSIDPLWFLVVGVVLLSLDVFLLNTTILLLFAFSLFCVAALDYFGFSDAVITWSIPAFVLVSAALQRPILGMFYRDKLPYEAKLSGIFDGTVFGGDDENMSSSYFYDFKDEKQVTYKGDISRASQLRVRLDDGRVYPFQEIDELLQVGARVRVRVTDVDHVILEKLL